MSRLKINTQFGKSFNKYPREKLKILQADKYLERAINSDEFRLWCLNHMYEGRKGFADTDMNNEQVYKTLMRGEEKLLPGTIGVWNFHLNAYWSLKRVLGYTYKNVKEIWMNMRYYSKSWWSPADICGNKAHEECHKLGFEHSFRRSKKWPFTVPYAVGNKVKKIVEVYEKEDQSFPSHVPVKNPEPRPDTSEIDKTMPKIGFFRRIWFKIKSIF